MKPYNHTWFLQTLCNLKSGAGISIPQSDVLNVKFEIMIFLKKLWYIYERGYFKVFIIAVQKYSMLLLIY